MVELEPGLLEMGRWRCAWEVVQGFDAVGCSCSQHLLFIVFSDSRINGQEVPVRAFV